MNPAIAMFLTFLGCCSNLIFLELQIKEDPGSGNLITFSQFLFIAVEGFIFTTKCGTKKPSIGFYDYFICVIMFFVANVSNNYAFNFNVPMPLHMIFRSGSLITNMIMCVIILKKSYSLTKCASVLLITLGIVICTIISGQEVKSTQPKHLPNYVPSTPWDDFFWWSVGIALLTVALFVSARMGIYQEELHRKYGKKPREALFYTHVLPLPFFLLLTSNIREHWNIAVSSTPTQIPVLGLTMPIIVLYLIGNVLSQFICISSVFQLTSECTSLTVTLVLTLRKFTSLIFSIIYFKNPFTVYHWVGTILVFIGTVMFVEIIPKLRQGSQKSVKKTQ